MEVEYTIVPKDVVAFNRYLFETSPYLRRSYRMGFVWGTLAAILLFIVLAGWKSWWNALLPLIFWLAYLVLLPLSVQQNINKIGQRMKKEGDNKGIWGKHRLTIDEQELLEETEVEESHLRWAGVERVAENDNYIFIFVSTNSAHVIPKKFIGNEAQAQVFYQTAKRYFESARQMAG